MQGFVRKVREDGYVGIIFDAGFGQTKMHGQWVVSPDDAEKFRLAAGF